MPGEYDDGATAFVQLPEGGIDALLAAHSPLAAPGHGYVPPSFTPADAPTGPMGDDTWGAPAEGARWGDQEPEAQEGAGQGFAYDPGPTGQWHFEEAAPAHGTAAHEAPPAPGHEVTGQWSIPVAGGDLPDESGEFTPSSLVEQWGTGAPATLPGGAPAPWATEVSGTAWSDEAHESAVQDVAEAAHEEPADLPEAVGGPPAGPYDHARAHGAPEDSEAAQEPPEPHGAPDPAAGTDSGAPDEQAPAPEESPEPVHGEEPRRDAGAAPAQEAQDAQEAVVGQDPAADEPEPGPEHTPEPAPLHDDHPLVSYVLRVNGSDRPVTDAWIGESLLYVLRERLGLAGAKDGCSQGECGACNVQVDGRLVASCLVPAVTAAGSEVRTVEGLAVDGRPSDVQRALARCGAVQCGFCVPGMAMTVHDLLAGNPAPTELETRQALCGNLCRCTGYRGVVEAVKEVVAERQAHAETEPEPGADTAHARIPHQAGPGAGGVHSSVFGEPAAGDTAFGDGFGATAPDGHPYGQDGGQA
ncbi:2Fe-2S iron-sulfur cluster-binding protein [Streptomyces sp. NPDC048664]|uniref:2Fe-2S iron-sulfur cluster-binding protein n=1 Tax=Streptomyces sp. NPDC048664 TaxID=3154505 RepID=UPI00341DC222